MKKILLFILVLIIPLPLFADPITVPDDYQTIQAAIDASAIGETINIKPGVYYENITIPKPLTINGDQATIDGQLLDTVVKVTGYEVSLDGLTIMNGLSGPVVIDIEYTQTSGSAAAIDIKGNYCSITNSLIYSNSVISPRYYTGTIRGSCVSIVGVGTYIDKCDINNNATISSYGGNAINILYNMSRNGTIISNSTISNNMLAGVFIQNSKASIMNCILQKNTGKSIIIESYPYQRNKTNVLIVNSIIAGNYRGIRCWKANFSLINSTVVGHSSWGITLSTDSNGFMGNSIIWNNGDDGNDSVASGSGSIAIIENSITTKNPGLTSDYHLQADSICIDAGRNYDFFNDDIDGQLRNDGYYDIGADEFHGDKVVEAGDSDASAGCSLGGNKANQQLLWLALAFVPLVFARFLLKSRNISAIRAFSIKVS